MSDATIPTPPVERFFPIALRSRLLLVGRENIRRSRSQLHFVLITTDLSLHSRQEILNTFRHYPVVQHYGSADLEHHFALKGTKVVGFKKSTLAQSIYAELKPFRINKPVVKAEETKAPAVETGGGSNERPRDT